MFDLVKGSFYSHVLDGEIIISLNEIKRTNDNYVVIEAVCGNWKKRYRISNNEDKYIGVFNHAKEDYETYVDLEKKARHKFQRMYLHSETVDDKE